MATVREDTEGHKGQYGFLEQIPLKMYYWRTFLCVSYETTANLLKHPQ